MTGKEIFAAMARGEVPPEIPFVPTIYEHAAKVIGKTPSQIAQNADLLVEGQLKCYEMYQHHLISVGVDIYGVEHEALGAKFTFYDDDTIPSSNDILVTDEDDLSSLRVPDPEKDGRMPVFLNACERIQKEIGAEVPVSGTIVGPFTLAAILHGFEDTIMDMLVEPEFISDLMDFCIKVGVRYAEAFHKRGVSIAINESWISPPMLSPNLYHDMVLEKEKRMIEQIKEIGIPAVALISGGNTTPIMHDMVKTGTSLLIADPNTDRAYVKQVCREQGIQLRANIHPNLVQSGTEEQIFEETRKVIDLCSDYNKFVFGCGVVSSSTTPDRILKLKEIVSTLNPRKQK